MFKKLLLGMCIMFILSTTLSYADLNTGLVAYYNMSDGNDTLGNYPMTTVSGVTFNETSKSGTAGHFDGNDYMESTVSHPFIGTGTTKPRTLNVWVNPIVNSPIGSIYDSGTASNDAEWGVLMGFSTNSYLLDLWAANAAVETIDYKIVMLTAFSNSTDNCIRVNNNISRQTCNTRGIDTGDSTIRIGRRISSFNQYYKGMIDEIGFWNRTLTDEEITELYNNGDGFFYPFAEDTAILDAYIINTSYEKYTSNIIDQYLDVFYIRVNYTLAGEFINNSICNYTAGEINHQYENIGLSNFSLNQTNNVTLLTDHDATGIFEDIIIFRTCREQSTGADIEVYINDLDTPYKTIDKSIIPTCEIGFHEEFFNFTDYITEEQINISLKCPTCLENSKTMRILKLTTPIIQTDRNVNLILIREHLNYTDDLTLNSTTSSYDDIDALHSLSNDGITQINISCNDSLLYEINVTAIPLIPVSTFLEIIDNDNDTIYSYINNNTVLETPSEISILGECYGSLITDINMNITRSDGTTLLKEINDTAFLTVNISVINESGTYITNLLCSNSIGNISLISQEFTINDTINPSITWNNPLKDNTTILYTNTSYNIDILFSDSNLFAYEVLLYDGSSTLIRNWSDTDLTVTSYNLLESITFNTTGTYTINTTVSDDHTIKEIPVYDYRINDTDSKLIFDFENIVEYERIPVPVTIEYVGVRTVEEVTLNKLIDRYTFDYKFRDSLVAGFNDKYIVSCPNIIFRSRSDYIAHFVCPESNNWIDFENMNVRLFYVKQLNNDSYEVELEYYNDNIREIAFNSIGGINIISEQTTFNVETVTSIDYKGLLNIDFTDIGTVLFIGIIVFIYLVFLIGSFVFKNIVLHIGSFIIGLFIGIIFISFNGWIGLAFLIINTLFLIIPITIK